jgi:hypothetical protein
MANKIVHCHALGVNRGNYSLYSLCFSGCLVNRGVFSPYLIAYFLDILVDLKIADQSLSWDKKMLGACLQAFFFLIFLPNCFFANYYTKSNGHSYFVFKTGPLTNKVSISSILLNIPS